MKIWIIAVLFLILATGCDTELGHQDHDHDGDGIQDHSSEEHTDEPYEDGAQEDSSQRYDA